MTYEALLTPKGITNVNSQHIGIPIPYNEDIDGTAVFSSDGSKYAIVWDYAKAEVFDFDRCSGEFSNPRVITIPDTAWGHDSVATFSCAFSPDSRYLYFDNSVYLWQADMQNPDPQSSLIIAGKYDTSKYSGNPNDWFFQMQLASDNKIYISTFGSANILDVIAQPDSAGLNSDFLQNGLYLPNPNGSIPNFPNYDLGPLDGSECDTLTSVSKINDNWKFSVFPNPVHEWLKLQYQSTENLQCIITDITGRIITHFTLYPWFKSRMYDVSNLPQGMYIVEVKDGKGNAAERKFVKQ